MPDYEKSGIAAKRAMEEQQTAIVRFLMKTAVKVFLLGMVVYPTVCPLKQTAAMRSAVR